MLKRISINILILLFVLGITNISFAASPKIYIEDVVKKTNDDKVTMDVHMENVNSVITSLRFDIKYDQSKLEYVSSKAGKNLKTTVQMSEYVEEKDKVSIGIMSSSGLKTDGIYYQITFKVLDDKLDEIPVGLEVKEATNTSGKSVNCNVSSGTVYTNEQKNPTNGNQSRKWRNGYKSI